MTRTLTRAIGLATSLLLLGGSISATAPASETTPFGIASFSIKTTETNAQGVNEPYEFTQAGGHPWALTNAIKFNSAQSPKDVIINLPAGLVANPQAVAHCASSSEHCPTDSQVGVFEIHLGGEAELAILGAIYNMTPYSGQAAELGLEVPFFGRILLVGHLVSTSQGYSLAIVGRGLPQFNLSSLFSGGSGGAGLPSVHLTSLETTLWGVPADPVHNPQRGILCFSLTTGSELSCQGGGLADGEESAPFLTLPGTCSGQPTATAWVDPWFEPDHFSKATATLPSLGYCERLPFLTQLTARPDHVISEEPLGLDLNIQVRQPERSILAAPQLRSAAITLPAGVSINPGVGDGARSCQATGPEGINIPTGLNATGQPLAPDEAGTGEEIPPLALGPEEPELVAGHCPEASVVGTTEAISPLLVHPLKGRVYLADPGCGGLAQKACTDEDAADGNLYRVYIELGGRGEERQQSEGVIVKLEGEVQANPANGQLTVKLEESPQLPLSELDIKLFGGTGALLSNPATCGAARTTSDLEPWSAPYTSDTDPTSYYNVTGCSDPSTFKPSIIAGTVNPSAGAFTPLTITAARGRREQYLSQLQLHTPPGLSALLASVPLCEEALANSGRCPQASRIGSSTVAAGSGYQPLYLKGNVYLTAGYEGSPFGLAIVTNAVAGPLNLGVMVIRARIDTDPETAALTITTNPLPQIVLGVPLRIQSVNLTIDRPNFIVNPTNCAEQQITATILGAAGAVSDVSNPFGIADCVGLFFKPRLTAQANGGMSFTQGTGLTVKLSIPKAPQTTSANMARVTIALPRELSSRLDALQHACLRATFYTNPAACPSASIIGQATTQTPILPGQLTGPVYLVTRGPQAVPSPIVILQGSGVRLDLRGSTAIGKNGVATVTFGSIPDLPIEALQLYLTSGQNSLLTANTNLCALTKVITVKRHFTQRVRGHIVHRTVSAHERTPPSLPLRAEFAAHNGAVTRQNTKIAVTGCMPSRSRHSA